MEIKITLEEIRKAQSDIAAEMSKGEETAAQLLHLEKASMHLRNMERLLVASFEKSLLATLKKETESLRKLTDEMGKRTKRLNGINGILRKITDITGQLISLAEVIK